MKDASPAFKYCVKSGGKVTVMNIAHGKKCKACVIHGKRYMGPVYMKKTALKTKGKKQ